MPDDAPSRAPSDAERAHAPAAVQSLREAMRRARADDAERAGVLSDLRAARVGRLEILKDALEPLLAQIPADVDLFDVAVMPGANPRLFIDMIGFVEMGRDGRVYRFLQDTRHGRVKLAESAEIARVVEAVTGYVARRLLERDKALAAEAADQEPTWAPTRAPAARPAPAAQDAVSQDAASLGPKRRPGLLTWAGIAFAFLIDLLGSIAFFSILAGIGWVLWNKYHGHV